MRFLTIVAISVFATACSSSVNVVDETVADTDEAASLKSTSTYYSVRHDMRRCVSPICGGYYVKRLNETYTTCSDGSSTTGECYVAEIDWSAADVDGATGTIVRGKISKRDYGTMGKFGVLTPSEVWVAATASTATGTYFRSENNGIVCIKAPCFTITADKLNDKTTRTASELGGANAVDASTAMTKAAIIVAGNVSDIAGGGRSLSVSQYWTRAVATPKDPTSCNVDADCRSSVYGAEVKSANDCYCTTCPTSLINAETEAVNQASWNKFCSAKKLTCPMYMCIKPRDVGCVSNKCQWVATEL